jgi:AcrR family transcriptional regulator
MPARAVTRNRGAERSAETRQRILRSVRELLAERKFHDCTVEEVAEHAGVSRATLYQHFRSRLDLVDAICDTMAVNPDLLALREIVDDADPDTALRETVAHSMAFWTAEDDVISQLYGVVAVDQAAADFVDRQRADRRGELARLAKNLKRSGRLGVSERRALSTLMVLTSYETFLELREVGLNDREIVKQLQDDARTLLFA